MSEAEEQLKPSYGLVAFFDILGYRQIIANNEIKEAASIVKRVLKKVTDYHSGVKWIEKELDYPSTKSLVFSDSILIYVNYSEKEETRRQQVAGFMGACVALSRELLEQGLPVRGAIAKGEYFIEQASFVGKAIVEAYEFANAIEMAGCVITPNAEAEFIGISDKLDTLFPFSVPLKGNKNQNLMTLNLCFGLLVNEKENTREFVIKQFSKHNKNITPEVVGKLNNTIDFLEQSRAAMRKACGCESESGNNLRASVSLR